MESELLLSKIARLYGLDLQKVNGPIMGYRNKNYKLTLRNGEVANFILYKNESEIVRRIKNTNYVCDYLADHGFAVRRTIDRRIAKLSSNHLVRYGALYNFLPGQTIPWEAYTRKHLKLLGRNLGDMHYALKDLNKNTLPNVHEEYEEILAQIQKYFASIGVIYALQSKLHLKINNRKIDYLVRVINECGKLVDQQALHMDFVRSNILFSTDEPLRISGILDFEKAAYGSPLFDVARTLSFLIVDCKYKSTEQVHRDFLISGYIRHSKTRFNDVKIHRKNGSESLLSNLVDIFLFYDFYKFLRHNPYEFLNQNEHYLRTFNILLERQIIKMVK